jgi:serine/threonine protein kinase
MGVVYLAEQEQPVRRRVALKVIKIGMDTHEVVARFEAERQALALMDHPCIAQIYDAGATAEGRPYFAMEYVAGIPITDYCDTHRLPMLARLDLFIQVCSAIQHAHQKGVIHRDIKPSNILVTVLDGKALPKVIDFGVAKATDQRLTEKTLFTQQGILIGTPAYMSPEQAERSGLAVDTTTDIYSLGVVLYQLLIDALPFDPEMLRRAGYTEIQRIICEQEPLRPSARLSSLRAAAAVVALQRQTALPALVRELRADLDWITLKAMAKDRTRRYASASELAADIERHLKTEPVIARPPSLMYRAGKFVRKHRAPLITVALVVTVSTVVSTVFQTQRALTTTVEEMITRAEVLKRVILHSAEAAMSRDTSVPWTSAIANDKATLHVLESAIYMPVVVSATVCDANGRVIVGFDRSMTMCPSGRSVRELDSISVLSVVRGTIPSTTTDYVSTTPLNMGSAEVGSIRIGLSRLLIAGSLRPVLGAAVFSSIVQLVVVALSATVAAWFVFRRDNRMSLSRS